MFDLRELLNELVLGARIKDLFGVAHDFFANQKREHIKGKAWQALELKPGAFGVKLDLKQGIELLKLLRS